ncbi:hypothetical protein [Providencia heimbachae]|uniref:Uncharacterized protein n=1 Tax=Providencia heimbachae ATCC 35613 TaxID=1354272 RepID=A0A1B7K2V7_9GAMM|nr:hypothetical protein [Providencia heimbachae]OAT54472.1 hypothetical protein M998_0463 [Providencia heimbachae ATCC 35613]SQH13522.1 Uncharacterised protein [Providencia heimbachae]
MLNKVIVNVQNWPICTINSFPETMDETRLWLEEMDLLLAKREQFALIYPPMAPKGKPSAEGMEGRKYVRRWLKHAKEPMIEYCRAMVITLQPDGSDKDDMERLAPLLSALYGPEVFLEIDTKMAQERAQSLLA